MFIISDRGEALLRLLCASVHTDPTSVSHLLDVLTRPYDPGSDAHDRGMLVTAEHFRQELLNVGFIEWRDGSLVITNDGHAHLASMAERDRNK
jgi:hypothetical protein